MASLFSALGNMAAQAGDARLSVLDDRKKDQALKLAQAIKTQQLSLATSRNDIERQRLGLETKNSQSAAEARKNEGWKTAFTFTDPKTGQKKQMNPITGEFREYQVPEGFEQDKKPSEMTPQEIIAADEKALGRKLTDKEIAHKLGITPAPGTSPYELKQDATRQYVYVPKDPSSGLKNVSTGLYGPKPKGNADSSGLHAPDVESLKANKQVMAMARKWKEEGIKPPAKYQAMVETVMDDLDWKARIKLPAADEKAVSALVKMEPPVQRLKKFLEDNKLTEQNAWIFGRHSALAQHVRFQGYKKGVAPEKVSSELIKDAAALQVQGAAPWMAIGRSKYTFETIVQHLPSPTDTPQNLYEKVLWLQTNILDDAKDSLTDDGISEYEKRTGRREGAIDVDAEVKKLLGK